MKLDSVRQFLDDMKENGHDVNYTIAKDCNNNEELGIYLDGFNKNRLFIYAGWIWDEWNDDFMIYIDGQEFFYQVEAVDYLKKYFSKEV